jgi:hypothetical protein
MSRPSAPLSRLVLPLLLFVACSGGDITPGAHRFTRSEEGGVPVSLSAGGPMYEGELFAYEEVGRLEQDESREETLLFRASQYLRGEDGCYYVCDTGNGRIAVFDEQGRYQRSIGRKGSGPGEFQSLQIVEIRDGVIATYDSRNRRAGRHRTDGTFLENISPPFNIMSARLVHPLADGRRVIMLSDIEGGAAGAMMRMKTDYLVVDAGGDTLAAVSTNWMDQGRMITIGHYGVTDRKVFAPQSGLEYRPGTGFLAWDGSRPELTWYDLAGKVARILRLDWIPEPVSEAARAGLRRSYEYLVQHPLQEEMRPLHEYELKHLEIADVYPFWLRVRVDDYGYHWLHRQQDYAAWEPDWTIVYSYEVLSPEGEHLGRTTFPSPGTISRGHLLTMQEDETTGEIAYIIYRLRPLPEGFVYP